ncbi:hypothetical protein AJ80_00668 [Polytolypa hystricis UAMH7299]|uniref:Zn(2)-C6 fungal-type domain-containing protein n=1 Tax=Polytolypa hystricis (strain UAMH7299) TaxID=1447883 RepID=A0A2B7YUB8_POLH7|nr:hypothetical protein AJ80_00668 [Polytolypa hystricis UAMH7299]
MATKAPSSTSLSPSDPHAVDPRFSPPQRSPSPAQQHRRGYQACDPCRKRKVKCDLGSVDNPRPPPCVRCRRESKRCEFSATRRKRKISEAEDLRDMRDEVLRRDARMMSAETTSRMDSNGNHDVPTTTYLPPRLPASDVDKTIPPSQRPLIDTSHHPTKRVSMPTATTQPYTAAPSIIASSQYQTHRVAGSVAYTEDGRTLAPPPILQSGQHMMNKTAADLLSPAISNTHDALHLLSEAAGRTEDLNRQHMESYRYTAPRPSSSTFTSSASPMAQISTPGKSGKSGSTTQHAGWYHPEQGPSSSDQHFDRADAGMGAAKAHDDVEYIHAQRAWSRLRFIRAGWFSVDEAMAYIAYYYEHLAPLSPIVLPDFSPPSTHLKLLTEEPVLAVTMLTIASRHMKLEGNGANSRAYSIHEKLWSYLRGMIERLFWGQEKFDTSSLPSNVSKSRDFGFSAGQPNLSGHLRSLGTVEALLMLTDWHPRALHFPPGDDENTLLDADVQLLSQINGNKDDENDADPLASKAQTGNSEGRVAFYKWLEPVWRSDRMSWMLLSAAQSLAFELGVFDQKNDLKKSTETTSEQARKRRVRRLILVYVSQSSGRLGIPSMLPLPLWNQNIDVPADDSGQPLDPNEGRAVDLMQDCWMDISKIMYTSNQVLFLSKEQTSNLIKTGRYRERIEEFIPSLREFRRKFDHISMSVHMRHILTIEYEYTRLYVNCLALQAVVERWTTMTNESKDSSASSGTAPLRVLMEQYQVNEPYIQEVVDASRNILRTALEGLAPGDYLKHAPVRTFFRILSGMIFILKTFTLGAKEDDVRISLELQDRTIECLRTCVVDDVHLSVTIAELLQLLTSNIRTRFLRFAPFERQECSSRERTPQPSTSRPQSPQAPDYPNSSSSKWQQQNHVGDGTSGFHFDSHSHSHNPSATPTTNNDPLASIPAQPINSSNLNVSYMPPPASMYHNYYFPNNLSPTLKMDLDDTNGGGTVAPEVINNTNNHPAVTGAGPSSSNPPSDWFALPLDQFFNSSAADVDQGLGGTGPIIGEYDMLELLLQEQSRDEGADDAG